MNEVSLSFIIFYEAAHLMFGNTALKFDANNNKHTRIGQISIPKIEFPKKCHSPFGFLNDSLHRLTCQIIDIRNIVSFKKQKRVGSAGSFKILQNPQVSASNSVT